MIKSIHINNYQSHKNTYLEFDKGVNVIIGSTDSGKTVMLRALNWLINNKPSGNSFRSNWGGDTFVVINLNNFDSGIGRFKIKNDNEYQTGEPDGRVFKSFGQDVPEEIKEILNFSELNIQYQMDSPFLLADSSGEVARYLNQVVNLDVIDRTLSNIEKKKREHKREIESGEDHLNKYQEELKQYNDLKQREEIINNLEKLDKDIQRISDSVSNLERIILKIDGTEEDGIKINEIIKFEDKVESLILLDEKINDLIKNKLALETITNSIVLMEEAIAEEELILIDRQKQFDELMPSVCPLCNQGIK